MTRKPGYNYCTIIIWYYYYLPAPSPRTPWANPISTRFSPENPKVAALSHFWRRDNSGYGCYANHSSVGPFQEWGPVWPNDQTVPRLALNILSPNSLPPYRFSFHLDASALGVYGVSVILALYTKIVVDTSSANSTDPQKATHATTPRLHPQFQLTSTGTFLHFLCPFEVAFLLLSNSWEDISFS